MWVTAGSIVVFVALLAAVTAGALGSGSVDARTEFAAHAAILDHHGLLRVARALTNLGAPLTVDLLALAAALALLLLRRPRAAAYVVVVRIAAQLLDTLIKGLVARHRPRLLHPVAHAAGYSFPSGHAAGAASTFLPIAVVVGTVVANAAVRRTTWVFAVLICLVVATTRVLLGVHFLSDVIAGLTLGTAMTCVLAPILCRRGRG